MLQAVVELPDESVEQVPLRCGVTISVLSSTAVVLARRLAVRGSGERPYPAGGGQPVVLDPSVGDRDATSRRSGDRRRSGVGLQCPSVGESYAVVSDLGSTRAPVESARPGKLVMIA